MPGLIAILLEAADIGDDNYVLQVGTGSGYTAALLSARLGSDRVTTVDIDPELTTAAQGRLAQAGYGPTIITGDGAAGYQAGAPYDRIIATCSVSVIPAAWLEQTRPGRRRPRAVA